MNTKSVYGAIFANAVIGALALVVHFERPDIEANIIDGAVVGLEFVGSASPGLSASDRGRLYYDTTADTVQMSLNGGAFNTVIGGTAASTQVAFFTATGTIAGDAGMAYNSGTDVLTITTVNAGNGTAAAPAIAVGTNDAGLYKDSGLDVVVLHNNTGDTAITNAGAGSDISVTSIDRVQIAGGTGNVALTSASGVVTTNTGGGASFTVLNEGTSWKTVVKATTESITSDSTLSDDAELKVTVAANTTYRIRMTAFITTNPTADFQFQLGGPASPTKLIDRFFWSAEGLGSYGEGQRAFASTQTVALTSGTTVAIVCSEDIMLENGANAGTVVFRWAQGTSNVGATVVNKGSYIEYAVVP